MKTIYVDASFSWTSTNRTNANNVVGRISFVCDDIKLIENVAIGKIVNLKQYINILELVAIARAVEIARLKGWSEPITIKSDSQVACSWTRKHKLKDDIMTEAHRNALKYFHDMVSIYKNDVIINQIPRDINLAGFLLEK